MNGDIVMAEELDPAEQERLRKVHGCAPRMYLQVKGPKDPGWCNLESRGYDSVKSKEDAKALLRQHRDRWEAQGCFPDHSYRIVNFAEASAP